LDADVPVFLGYQQYWPSMLVIESDDQASRIRARPSEKGKIAWVCELKHGKPLPIFAAFAIAPKAPLVAVVRVPGAALSRIDHGSSFQA
jgi:hypothetical protein